MIATCCYFSVSKQHAVVYQQCIGALILICTPCSKEAKEKGNLVGDKESLAAKKAREASKLEDEASSLAERAQRAQERAEATEKEAHKVRTGLSGLQGEAKAKRSAAERYCL